MSFAGEFVRTLDAKGRLVMPTKFKEEFAEDNGKFVLWRFPKEKCIRIYTLGDWETLMKDYFFVDDGTDKTKLQRKVAKNTVICEPDAQGRFSVPQAFLEKANIKKDVVFFGVVRRGEIWSYEDFYEDISDSDDDEETGIITPF